MNVDWPIGRDSECTIMLLLLLLLLELRHSARMERADMDAIR